MAGKTVEKVQPSVRDDIGDLVTRRPLPGAGLPDVDPFLFLNHHGPQVYPPRNRGLPFGPHPHRGFETVTFILEGSLAHHDSGGSSSVIEAGGIQWMTAGRGLVHAEISPDAFRETGGPLEILQLWVNLPARLKMTDPAYTGLQAPDIPVVEEAGVHIRLISGKLKDATGPYQSLTGVFMSVVEFDPDSAISFDGLDGRNVFFYVVRGDLKVEGVAAPEHHLVVLSEAGDTLAIRSPGRALALFGHAEPLREPIVSHGPFVMTSVEEIEQAIRDYRTGQFGGLPQVSA